MYDQLMQVSPADIDEMLNRFGSNRSSAQAVLNCATQFGAMDNMCHLMSRSSDYVKANWKLYTPGGASVADNLVYLADKKNSFDAPGQPAVRFGYNGTTTTVEPGTFMILDEAILRKLETDPTFAKEVLQHQVRLVVPTGFESGISLFNSPSIDSIEGKLQSLHARAQEIVQSSPSPVTPYQATLQALNERVEQRMAAVAQSIGQPANAFESLTESMLPHSYTRPEQEGSVELIANQLNGSQGINYKALEQFVNSLAPEDRPLMREMLVQQSDVYSARSLALIAQQQHNAIMNKVSEGLPPADAKVAQDNVYYLVPEQGRSYGMVGLIYRQANDVDPQKFVSSIDELRARGIDESKVTIVILDDVAGTGDSLVGKYSSLRSSGGYGSPSSAFNGRIIISPSLSTQAAIDGDGASREGFAKMCGKDPNLTYLPMRVAPEIKGSELYKNASPADQDAIIKLAGGIYNLGWGKNGLCVAFPYMSPDNNNLTWVTHFAKNFTLNGQGVKQPG
jgi:hypothetical protein